MNTPSALEIASLKLAEFAYVAPRRDTDAATDKVAAQAKIAQLLKVEFEEHPGYEHVLGAN